MTDYERNIKQIDMLHMGSLQTYDELISLYSLATLIQPHDVDRAVKEMKIVRNYSADLVRRDDRFYELYWQAMLFLARNRDLDSYLQ